MEYENAVGSDPWLAEQVTGPHHGYYIGSYATATGDGFVAYSKIFRDRPDSPWDGHAIGKLCAHSDGSHMIALSRAESRARTRIENWAIRAEVDLLLDEEWEDSSSEGDQQDLACAAARPSLPVVDLALVAARVRVSVA